VGVTHQQAGGELPVRGIYGVPEQWPHISALYERAGFSHTGHTGIVHLARVSDLRRPAGAPITGLCIRRSVGMNGTRLSAVLGQDTIGFIEVETFDDQERRSRHGGWADVGNLQVAETYRRQGVATWLLGQAADWLRLAQVECLLDYAWLQGTDPRRPGLCGLPGIPPGRRFPGNHPHPSRMEPGRPRDKPALTRSGNVIAAR
jgi:GNAT superfamily N-acetyltransferase